MSGRAFFLLIPLGTLVLALWAGAVTMQNPAYLGAELLSNGTVHHVDSDGPAAEADLRLGDHVTSVEGRPLLASVTLLRGKSAGETVTLSIRRAGSPITIPVVLDEVTGREFIFSIERLFVGLIFWIVGVAAWLVRPRQRAAMLFFAVSQVASGMFFAEILDPGIPAMSVVTDFSRYLIGPLLLHFFATFPRPLAEPLRTNLLRAVYAGYGVVAALFAASLIFSLDLYPSGLWLTPRIFEVVVGIIALAVLLRPQPTASLNAHRWRGILVTGMLLGIAPIMVTLMSMVVAGGRPLVPYEWTVPALALTPMAYGYALYKSELGRADWIFNRSLVYMLLTGVLLGGYALLYLAFDAVFSDERGWGHLLSGVLLVLCGSTLFVPLRTRLQHGVDRFFYGGWYDYRSFVQSASAELARFTNIRDLAEQLKTAAETMRFKSGTQLWPRGDTLVPIGAYGLSRRFLSNCRIRVDSAITTALTKIGRPCTQSELLAAIDAKGLTAAEMAMLRSEEINYWMPLVSRGTLRSILLAGPRQRGESLDPEDRAILSTLSTQAAIACDNIALLESLQERLAEVERVRDELAEAQNRLTEGREDERTHLARELHDGPIQDLYAMLHEVEMLAAGDGQKEASRYAPWRATVHRVASTLRDICVELRPPLLTDFGLDVTIRSHVVRFREKHPEIDIQLDLLPLHGQLPERTQLAVFRICQEALNNAVQHGQADTIRVRFEADAERILLEIADDGCGFVVPKRWIEFGRQGHLGLLGIAERAESIGGTLSVISKPGSGTILRVVAPWPESAEMVHPPPETQST